MTRSLQDALKGIDVETKDIVTTGTHPLTMNDAVWDDLTIPAQSQDLANPNPPSWRLRVDGGNTSTAKFLLFSNGTHEDTYATVAKTASNSLAYAINPQWSLSLWVKPEARESGIIELEDNVSLHVDQADNFVFRWGTKSEVTLLTGVTYGQWYHILVRSDATSATRTTVQVYLNNVRKHRKSYRAVLGDSPSTEFILGALGDNADVWYNGDVAIEEMILYNDYVSNSQRDELWNLGEGRDSIVTGTTLATDVAMWFHFDQTTGTAITDSATMANTPDGAITGTHYSWEDGGVGNGNNAIGGLKSLFFEAGNNQQVEFSEQVLHYFATGSAFEARLHMHIQLDADWDASATLPQFVLEYSINNVFENEGNTLEITSDGCLMNMGTPVASLKNRHGLIMFHLTAPSLTQTNAGEPVSASAMISGRIYRKHDDGSDFGVFQLQSDFHLKKDKVGTSNEWNNL